MQFTHNELMFGHWTAGVVIELLCGYWTSKKGKQNCVIKNEENSDYYYLSNRKMIEVIFSSWVRSLLAFYFRESFKRTNGSLTDEKDEAGSACKGNKSGHVKKSIY